MDLSLGWIIFIVIIVFGIIISNIMLLKHCNKAFVFPENYKKTKKENNNDDDDSSGLI